jgi:DNA-binding NtrC family response regulator
MEKDTVRVLLIENDADYANSLKDMLLLSHNVSFDLTIAPTFKEGIELLSKGGIDLILLDLWLPECSGLETLKKIMPANPDLPIIVITNHDADDMGLEALHLGAQEYLVKGRINWDLLEKTLRFSIERHEMLRQLRGQLQEIGKREMELRKIEEKYRAIFEIIQDVCYEVDINGKMLEISPSIHNASKYIEILRSAQNDISIFAPLSQQLPQRMKMYTGKMPVLLFPG